MTLRRPRSASFALSCAAVVATAVVFPAPAYAHLVQTGFGEFYDGLGHFMLTLPDLFVVIALALLAGASGAPSARSAVIVLPAIWLAAGLAGRYAEMDWVSPWATTALFGVFGAMVALDLKLSPAFAVVASGLAGLLHGWSNGAGIVGALGDAETLSRGGLLALVGITTGVFALVTVISALVAPLHEHAVRIAVRVAGSWLTAISILMLGWLARSGSAV